MDGEQLFGMIIMCVVSFGCGALFYGIGLWAQKRKDPMHFYAGTTVDPKRITDIPAYNEENASMWKRYSLPYFTTGVLEIASAYDAHFSIAAIVLLITAGTIGIFWLLWQYKLICSRYMIPEA